jgi:hypothetical protein
VFGLSGIKTFSAQPIRIISLAQSTIKKNDQVFFHRLELKARPNRRALCLVSRSFVIFNPNLPLDIQKFITTLLINLTFLIKAPLRGAY